MDPYDERRLTEEVLHLHSLWRRGPPKNCKSIPNHSAIAVANVANRIPSNKRPGGPQPPKAKKKKKKPRPAPDHPQESGPEWPCPEPVQNQPSTSSGWPAIQPCATPAAQPVSSEERAKLSALQLQYKEFKACRGFFARNADSGSEVEEEEEEEEEENDGGITKIEEYKFFLKMFVENSELGAYYEKNYECGSFCCLVCGGMGKKKSGKRFKSCVGLVQHSISISRTKKKRAHRAFGLVICRVLGWDVDRLPIIVLKGEPLSRSLADSGEPEVQPEDNHVAKEGGCGVKSENDDQKNEEKLEEDKAAEDPDSNAKNSSSGENVNGCKENDVNMQEENTDNSIPGMGSDKEEMKNLPVLQPISKACKEFFAGFSPSTSDELNDGDGLEEREEFKFFLKLFTENDDLRGYYESNYEDGEFVCLACEGAGKKTPKGFKTCGRLLQHSTSLAKNRIGENLPHDADRAKMLKMKTLAHRAYSSAVCKVLGWDVEELPSVVLKGEPLGRSLTKPGVSKDEIGNVNYSISGDPMENGSIEASKLRDDAVCKMNDLVGNYSDRDQQIAG
ncbi:uncharacterized protein LOC111012232 isoform X2 [Momordica charantia]|uniref:Uncharacterized protein LOC111012232 isoform X2 n=1 Tax=Momordica charantia TaxID=3673 RepID=A0A6J1CJP3_MOMCH|nr:uncharacterized protein LOC111012232 isoform X2 [Momordica charantia]